MGRTGSGGPALRVLVESMVRQAACSQETTPQVEEYFGKPSGSGVPLARFSRLFDVLNNQILQADMVPYATGERELAAEYLLYSRPDDLFLYDRGYPAFWLFAFQAWPRNSVITVRVCGMTFIPKSKPSWRMALRSAWWS